MTVAPMSIESVAGFYLAALPMYDLPELQSAHNALWTAIALRLRAHGVRDVPSALTRADDLAAIWRNPALLLAQACGYPLVTTLADRVQLIATPIYDAPGCEGAMHRSAIVVNATSDARDLDALRYRVCAVNGLDSNTGMNLLRASIAPLAKGRPFFSEVLVSGSHRESLRMVADGSVDVAAIDAVTLALLQRVEPHLVAATRVLDWTAASPGLPLISAAATDTPTLVALRSVLIEIADDPALSALRGELVLSGFKFVPLDAYARVLAFETDATALGFPHLI